ncbi:MAG: pyruvate synthase, partial [Nitrospirota bacterium]
ASMNGLEVFKEVCAEFKDIFGREYDTTDDYMMDDAEYVLIMMDSFSTLGKAAVKKAREKGIKAGLLRLRLLRPFPAKDIMAAIKGKKAVTVLDQNISIGKGGILYSEIASVICNEKEKPLLLSFISGLGGKNMSPSEFEFIFDAMINTEKTGIVPEPHLLYTETEWKEMERVKKIAGKKI